VALEIDIAVRVQHFQLKHFWKKEEGKNYRHIHFPYILKTTVLWTQITLDNTGTL
jgi:hypothetical protein